MEPITPEVRGQLEKPLIVVTPHSSTYIPPDLEERLAIDQDEVRRFTDMYTDELFGEAPNLGGILIPGSVSRFVVQLNKMTAMRDGRLNVWDKKLKDVADANPKNPDSSFIRYSWTGNQVMQPELTEEEMVDIFEKVYQPFFDAIDKAVAEAQAKFGYSILIEGDSFNSISVKGKPKHANFVLGTRDWQTADGRVIRGIMEELIADRTLGVRNIGVDNYGWNGSYITGHYSRLANAEEMKPKGIDPKNAHAVQIEVSKDQYMGSSGGRCSTFFPITKEHISKCLELVCKF
jgi:N-formylglutamate amidohydrolase